MGRQIAIAMEPEDEEAFLAFLQASADVALYRSWSETPTSVSSFVSGATASPFWVHNKAFPWEATFEPIEFRHKESGAAGTYHRLITRHAPVLEYSRHPMGAPDPQVSGRIYWSKLFVSQPHELRYDLAAFDVWFSSVAKWVRKHGERVVHGATEPWCLPAARRRLLHET